MSEFCPACGGRGYHHERKVASIAGGRCAYCGTSGRVTVEKWETWERLAE